MKHPHSRKCKLPFNWPEPALQVVLVHPAIPPNTGNIARLCAATGTPLHLIEPLGFRINNSKLRRAGLDYWDSVVLGKHKNFDTFLDLEKPKRYFCYSTAGTAAYTEAHYQPGDVLVFGSETKGLPEDLIKKCPEELLGIPIRPDHVRSLNLSSAVAIVLYEALRQISTK